MSQYMLNMFAKYSRRTQEVRCKNIHIWAKKQWSAKKWEHLENHQVANISQESYNTIKKIKQNFHKSLWPETEYAFTHGTCRHH